MKYKISIVVPIYNAEKYLKECVESIINQTIGFENLQVILVDDGSTDKSGEIADKYSGKYDNIIAVHLRESHYIGGAARNEGIKQAEGEYIMFIDSDDCFKENACENMYHTASKNNADIVTGNYKCMDEKGKLWNEPIFDRKKYPSCELKEVNEKFFYLYCPSVCMKIFKLSLIEQNEIEFLEGVPAEDAYFSSFAFLKSEKIYYLDEEIYYYRRRNSGNVSTSWMRNKKYFMSVNYAFRKIYELFEKENKVEYYQYFYAKNLISLLYKFIDSKLINNEERIEIIDKMSWFWRQASEFNMVLAQRIVEILLEDMVSKEYKQVIKECEMISEARTFMNEEQKEMMSKPQKMIG